MLFFSVLHAWENQLHLKQHHAGEEYTPPAPTSTICTSELAGAASSENNTIASFLGLLDSVGLRTACLKLSQHYSTRVADHIQQVWSLAAQRGYEESRASGFLQGGSL